MVMKTSRKTWPEKSVANLSRRHVCTSKVLTYEIVSTPSKTPTLFQTDNWTKFARFSEYILFPLSEGLVGRPGRGNASTRLRRQTPRRARRSKPNLRLGVCAGPPGEGMSNDRLAGYERIASSSHTRYHCATTKTLGRHSSDGHFPVVTVALQHTFLRVLCKTRTTLSA